MWYVLKLIMSCEGVHMWPLKNLMGKKQFLPIYGPRSQHFEPNHSIMRGKSANLKQQHQSVHTKHGGIPKPRAEIGCSLGAWDEAGKRSNLYNFHCMTASVSVFGSRGWAGGFSTIRWRVPWSNFSTRWLWSWALAHILVLYVFHQKY